MPIETPARALRAQRRRVRAMPLCHSCPAPPAPDRESRMSMPSTPKPWCLYLIECRNGSFYAGITNDLEARYAAHVAGRGARYTRANPPLRLIGSRAFPDRASAARAECAIRRLPRASKIGFLHAGDAWRPADPAIGGLPPTGCA